MVPAPTLPADPGVTACTFTCAVPPPQVTSVLAEVWAKTCPSVFVKRCPRGKTRPGDGSRAGFARLFVYTTTPVDGASCTCTTPVVLKPCEFEAEMTLVRTRTGGLPGWAWISTSRYVYGWA